MHEPYILQTGHGHGHGHTCVTVICLLGQKMNQQVQLPGLVKRSRFRNQHQMCLLESTDLQDEPNCKLERSSFKVRQQLLTPPVPAFREVECL